MYLVGAAPRYASPRNPAKTVTMSVRRPLLKALLEIVINPGGAIGHLFDALFASRDRRAAVAALFDEPEPWTPDRSPAALLDGDRGVVPFHAGRERELADLDAWLDDPEGLPLMVRLYFASGGYGKTRLLRELVKRRRADGAASRRPRGERWDASFLREAAAVADLPPLLAGRRPLLLVLDYAESRGAQVRALVAAARAAKRPRIRLVLLARSDEGWWDELKSAGAPTHTLASASPHRGTPPTCHRTCTPRTCARGPPAVGSRPQIAMKVSGLDHRGFYW